MKLSRLDKMMYGLGAWAAAVAGVGVAPIILLIVAWGGFGSSWADPAAICGVASALLLFIGAIGSGSERYVFPVLTVAGSVFFPLLSGIMSRGAIARLPWMYVAVVLIDVCSIGLAIAKIKQLRDTREHGGGVRGGKVPTASAGLESPGSFDFIAHDEAVLHFAQDDRVRIGQEMRTLAAKAEVTRTSLRHG